MLAGPNGATNMTNDIDNVDRLAQLRAEAVVIEDAMRGSSARGIALAQAGWATRRYVGQWPGRLDSG